MSIAGCCGCPVFIFVCVFPDSSKVLPEDLQNIGKLLYRLQTLILHRLPDTALWRQGQQLPWITGVMDTLSDLEISGELHQLSASAPVFATGPPSTDPAQPVSVTSPARPCPGP